MKTRIMYVVVACLVALGLTAKASDWETDFTRASTNAAKMGQYMLLDFSGSDWCGWCIKLDQEVFSQNEFKQYAKDNLVCVLLDFPRKTKQSNATKEQNQRLAKKYGVRGFPTVIVLAPDGSLAGQTGYQPGGAKLYVEHLKGIINTHKKQHPKS